MITWVLFLGIGLVVGIIAGLYFARLDDVSNKQKKALQQKLESAEQQLKTYQSQVTDHFLKTASLVNTMTESYKAVHEHLAVGARELCDNQVNVAQLEMPNTRLLDNAGAASQAAVEKPVMTTEAVPTEAKPAERQTSEQQTAAEQKPQPQDKAPEAETRKEEAVKREEFPESEQVVSFEQAAEHVEHSPKDKDEAVQPPSTPESLHVDDSESTVSKSLKDSEQTTPANVSRMVH